MKQLNCNPRATHIVMAQHGIMADRKFVTWPERLEAWTATHDPAHRLQFVTDQYNAGPFPRFNMLFLNKTIGKNQANVLEYWQREGVAACRDIQISMVGHSNGCAVIVETALALYKMGICPRNIIFIAPPLSNTFKALGMTELIRDPRLRRMAVWCSPNDHVLNPPTNTFAGALRGVLQWPYGNMGRVGALDVSKSVRQWGAPKLGAFNRWFDCGHCDYFAGDFETRTFKTILTEITT